MTAVQVTASGLDSPGGTPPPPKLWLHRVKRTEGAPLKGSKLSVWQTSASPTGSFSPNHNPAEACSSLHFWPPPERSGLSVPIARLSQACRITLRLVPHPVAGPPESATATFRASPRLYLLA
jgi:hypothetical protein